MIRYIKWGNRYTTGIGVFDEQHKKIMGLLNQLLSAVKQNGKTEKCRDILNELMPYSATHFDAEEEAMKKFRYPYYKKHCEEHIEIKMKIGELHKKCMKGDKPRTVEILKFISHWMDKHLKNDDINYGPFLIKKGFK